MKKLDIKRNIKFLQIKQPLIDYDYYKKLMSINTFVALVLGAAIASFFTNDLDTIIIAALLLAIFVIAVFYYYPYAIKRKYIGKIEKDLPFFLMDFDIKLSIGMNFIAALESLTKEYGFLGKLFKRTLNQYEKGIPFHKSFSSLAKFYESQDFKRALNQIFAVYQTGYSTEQQGPLFMLAEELLDKQKAEAKVYHSKLVMISLLFIGVTALVPSLYLVFVTIGGTIIDVGVTPIQLMLMFVLVFPLIDVIIIFVIYNIMPAYMK